MILGKTYLEINCFFLKENNKKLIRKCYKKTKIISRLKENFNLLCKIVSRISIRSWEEWVEGFSHLFNKILYDLKPG